MQTQIAKILLPILALACLTPWVSSWAALLMGLALAVTLGNPYADFTSKYTSQLLAYSVIGLGAGMNLNVVASVGAHGIGYTIIDIACTLLLGFAFATRLKIEREAGILISIGTAICGGSAIAAVAPTIRAKSQSISIALGTVFMLNAVALVIFPPLGHFFGLTQTQFGLWSALAIHDTSSVVGATLQYGNEALQIGTTVKLARALWIVPVTVACGFLFAKGDASAAGKAKRPWFILGFLIAAALVTYIPAAREPGQWVDAVAKRTLVLTLYFIGTNLTLQTLKSVGIKPLVLEITLWLLAASGTLAAILAGWIG